jgi:4-hydroxy-tetrahydrodipicolinate reductase
MSIRIIVAGATGRMGQEIVNLIKETEHFALVCGVARSAAGKDVGEAIGLGKLNAPCYAGLEEALANHDADVLVDVTSPEIVYKHMRLAIEAGIRPVVGTTGLSAQEIDELDMLCRERGIGAIIAPNFALGAVLMMLFAKQAAKYFPHVEIIEQHHDRKLDAPSGTAIKTAELIAQNRVEMKQGHPQEEEKLQGARGAYFHGFRIHSVRLPGLVAHQEVIFGGNGQLLTIRHDSFNRESFMPGVKLAVEKVMQLDRLVYGLENILDLDSASA